jgi:hypothetical protein
MSSRLQIWLGTILLLTGCAFLAIQLWPGTTGQGKEFASLVVRANNAGLALNAEDGDVYIYSPDSSEQLVAQGRISRPIAVPAGHYDVRVRFSGSRDQQTQWLRKVVLAAGEVATHEVAFAAGELSFTATVGSIAGEPGEIVAYVFQPGQHEDIVTSLGTEEPIVLGAGEYDLRVVWSVNSHEKDARWFHRIQVKTGLQTKLEVAFDRGLINVQASNAGEPMALGSVSLGFYRAGDIQQQIIESGTAGVPIGLNSGAYDIKATYTQSGDKPERWLRNVIISDGELQEATVDFSSGALVVNAELTGGSPLELFDVYIYYYLAGKHQEAVAYTPAGNEVILEGGQYDIRGHFFRSDDRPDIWIRGLSVTAGQTVSRTLSFSSGRLLLRAYDHSGAELIGDNVFVYVYGAGEHSHPLASARSGQYVTLTEGVYDVRAEDTRSKGNTRWLKNLRLRAGSNLEESVTF